MRNSWSCSSTRCRRREKETERVTKRKGGTNSSECPVCATHAKREKVSHSGVLFVLSLGFVYGRALYSGGKQYRWVPDGEQGAWVCNFSVLGHSCTDLKTVELDLRAKQRGSPRHVLSIPLLCITSLYYSISGLITWALECVGGHWSQHFLPLKPRFARSTI
jgi:hypothetical protein